MCELLGTVVLELGDPKIHHFDKIVGGVVLFAEVDIFGFDIAMDDALVVCVGHRIAKLLEEGEGSF